MGNSRGIERLVALAGLSASWCKRTLEDPLAAAEAAEIELSENERSILASVPREALKRMIHHFTASEQVDLSLLEPEEDQVLITGILPDMPVSLGHMPDLPERAVSAGERPDVPPPTPPAPTGIRPDTPKTRPPAPGVTRSDEPLVMSVQPPTPVTGSRSDIPKKIVAGAATLAALGAAGTCIVSSSLSVSRGVRPDVPPPKVQNLRPPKVTGLSDVDTALAGATMSGRDSVTYRAVMVALPHPNPPAQVRLIAGITREDMEASTINSAQRVVTEEAPLLTTTILEAGLSPVRVEDPWAAVKNRNITDEEQKQYEALESPYEALLEKHGLKGKLPAVLFLAPDGSELGKAVRPTTKKELLEAVANAQTKLAEWIAARRKRGER
jgi:hypothetical protein